MSSHMSAHELLGAQIARIQAKCFGEEDGVRYVDKLLGMFERETRAVAALLRTMRLTQQTRVEKGAAARMTSGQRPSYYENGRDMTSKDKQALEVAMHMLADDRQWGPALQERLAGKRYATLHPT